MIDTLLLNQILQNSLTFLGAAWFVWVPAALLFVFKDVWVMYLRAYVLERSQWILLEIKVPREIAKSPKAMESIFAGIHGTGRKGNLIDRFWKGVLPAAFSLEIVGDHTGAHFYIWTHAHFKKMLETQIYAQYPGAEIAEADDYTANLPSSLPNHEWDLWGTEFVFTKPDAYPIRTYEDFTLEKVSTKEEETKIDPLSSLVEFLGSLGEGERVWVQMLIRPANDQWKKEGEKLAAKLAGREPKVEEPLVTKIVYGINNLFSPAPPSPEKKEMMPKIASLTPGEKDILTLVEKNIAKIGFETGIRWLYLARRDAYNPFVIPAVMGIFKQFASPALNGFAPNKKVTTSIDYFFKKTLLARRKFKIYNAYRLRSYFLPPYRRKKKMVLASSELATVYHFPGDVVHAPGLTRVEAKRGAPPSNLPL